VISGALEIICGVEAGLVNPLLLPASQGPEKFGYIVIAYDDSPGVFDILFLRGNRVEEYAGFYRDLRMLENEYAVKLALASCSMRCRVYLFSVSRRGFDRFLRTFHCVPSINVVIDRLSRKQLSSLLEGTGCKNGILEIDSPAGPFPLITLTDFASAEELQNEALRCREGRMIVYDLELNSLIRRHVDVLIGDPRPEVEQPAKVPPSGKPPGAREDSVGNTQAVEEHPEEPGESDSGSPDAAGLAGPFRDALGEFRKAVTGLYGKRLDQRVNHVLSHYFPSPGPFDPALVEAGNAVAVLDVIEECVKRAWLYNRRKLRAQAAEIVRNLYDLSHDTLQSCGVDRNVQECFRRLSE
jgi:hypothetical protein